MIISVATPDILAEPADYNISAFVLKGDNKISEDRDFVFYNNAHNPSYSASCLSGTVDGEYEKIVINTKNLPEDATKVAFVAFFYKTLDKYDRSTLRFMANDGNSLVPTEGQYDENFLFYPVLETDEFSGAYSTTEINGLPVEVPMTTSAFTFAELTKVDDEWEMKSCSLPEEQGGLYGIASNYGLALPVIY